MSRKRNFLKANDRIRLYEWLRKNQETISKHGLTQEEVARWAGKELDVHVSEGNIQGLASERPNAVIQYKWPRSHPKLRSRSKEDPRVAVVARAVDKLRGDLGILFEGELGMLWDELMKECK